MYNINEGRNKGIVSRCEELRCYAYFVDRVRYHEDAERKRNPSLDKESIGHIAMRKAMQDCKDKGLLVDFWDNLSPEEINMLGFEWDMNIAMEVEREEAFKEGIEKGREEGIEKGRETEREELARNMLRKGFSCEQTAELSGLDIERVRELSSSI